MIPRFHLETKRLRLREFRLDEAEIHEYASDAEVVRYTDWGPNDLASWQTGSSETHHRPDSR